MTKAQLESRVRELKAQNHTLRIDNLKMRLHFDVLTENINSRASKKILAIYGRKRKARQEIQQAMMN